MRFDTQQRTPTRRRIPPEFCDGHRKGRAAHGHPCDPHPTCHLCTLAVKPGDTVGRSALPKRIAHWDCLKQKKAEDRGDAGIITSCFLCGRTINGDTLKVRGRWRQVCTGCAAAPP